MLQKKEAPLISREHESVMREDQGIEHLISWMEHPSVNLKGRKISSSFSPSTSRVKSLRHPVPSYNSTDNCSKVNFSEKKCPKYRWRRYRTDLFLMASVNQGMSRRPIIFDGDFDVDQVQCLLLFELKMLLTPRG